MGTPTQINKQAEQVLKEILTNPEVKRTVNSMQARKYGGNVIDYTLPNGKGARFNADESKFIGFLEPKK